MEFRGIMGGFYRISEWIMRLSAINILWIICSSPFFFVLVMALFAPYETPELMIQSLKSMALIMGLLFVIFCVPASAAMFAVARKWVTGEEDVPLFKSFFRNYKENYKQSLLGGFIFLFIAFVFYINYNVYLKMDSSLRLLSLVFLILSVLLIAAFINYLCIMVHFHMKTLQMVKNSVIMTLGQPFSTLAMLVSNGFIVFISFRYTFLIPFFMGSLCAISSFWYFNRGFQRIQMKAEAFQKKQEELNEAVQSDDTENKLGSDGQTKQ